MYLLFDERLDEACHSKQVLVQGGQYHLTQQQKLQQHKFIHALCPDFAVLTDKRYVKYHLSELLVKGSISSLTQQLLSSTTMTESKYQTDQNIPLI